LKKDQGIQSKIKAEAGGTGAETNPETGWRQGS